MSEEADDAGEAAEADAKGRSTVPWMPTCTAATEFFRTRRMIAERSRVRVSEGAVRDVLIGLV